MIAYVNGYVCTTSCEAAAARAGRDPFAPPGRSGNSDKTDKSSGLDGQSATVFSGSLANLNPTNAVTPTGDTSAPSQPSLNILA